MGGDPDLNTSLDVIGAVVRGGADILEIGIPFSDPIADGPAIQAAGVRALSSGTKPKDVMGIVTAVNRRYDIPVVIMTYYNPVLSYGVREFLGFARSAGVDGLIIPDLPLEEAQSLGRMARSEKIDSILLAAPTTSAERMEKISASTSGFLYLVSVLGVTGTRERVEERTVKLVRSARKFTGGRIPLAVGFGISKPEHVRRVLSSGADAAIVGSAIVERVGRIGQEKEGGLADLEGFVRSMKLETKIGGRSIPKTAPGSHADQSVP